MKYILLLAFKVLFFQKLQAQKQQVQVSFGRSFNGTGDIRGFGFATEYNKYFKKKLSWSASFGGTIHDDFIPIIYEYPAGSQNDGSVRYTIAGFQVASHLSYNFLKPEQHELLFRLGAVLRYQSSSYYDDVAIYYPAAGTGFPIPVVVFNNTSPQRTFAVGASPQISYSYIVNKKTSLGLLAGFQFDTNGDNISQLSLTVGRRF